MRIPCSACIAAIGSGCGSRTAVEIKGLPPPETQTDCVWTASVLPDSICSVEFRAPACSPPVALEAPTGFGDTVSSEIIGVVTRGTYGPQLYEQYPGTPRTPAWARASAGIIRTTEARASLRILPPGKSYPGKIGAGGVPVLRGGLDCAAFPAICRISSRFSRGAPPAEFHLILQEPAYKVQKRNLATRLWLRAGRPRECAVAGPGGWSRAPPSRLFLIQNRYAGSDLQAGFVHQARVRGGTRPAVVLLEAFPNDSLMLAVAADNSLAETAFLVPEGTDFRVRWFTPRVEVPLCGHATLASAAVVMEKLDRGREQVVFHSLSGPLRVRRSGAGYMMDLPARPSVAVAAPPALLEGLGF